MWNLFYLKFYYLNSFLVLFQELITIVKNNFRVFVFITLGQFVSVFLECFHFLVFFRRRIYMRATHIYLDVVETVHQTVVHCTVGSILQSQNKIEKSGWVGVGCPLAYS